MKCERITLAFGSGSGAVRGVQWLTQIARDEQCANLEDGEVKVTLMQLAVREVAAMRLNLLPPVHQTVM